jgi:hypothetical protein
MIVDIVLLQPNKVIPNRWKKWRCGRKWGKRRGLGHRVGLVTLLAIEWKELDHDVEFLSTFVIKGSKIYFGRKNIVYVISKQLIVDAFDVC